MSRCSAATTGPILAAVPDPAVHARGGDERRAAPSSPPPRPRCSRGRTRARSWWTGARSWPRWRRVRPALQPIVGRRAPPTRSALARRRLGGRTRRGRPGLARGRDHRPRPSRVPDSIARARPAGTAAPAAEGRCGATAPSEEPAPPAVPPPVSAAPVGERSGGPHGRGAAARAARGGRWRRPSAPAAAPTVSAAAPPTATCRARGRRPGRRAGHGALAAPGLALGGPRRGRRLSAARRRRRLPVRAQPSTGRVVLDVSPPEARGRVRLTVAGADLGVPTHWPVVHSAPVGKVEILASADGFKPALVEANVVRGDGGDLGDGLAAARGHRRALHRAPRAGRRRGATRRPGGEAVRSARPLRRRAGARRRAQPSGQAGGLPPGGDPGEGPQRRRSRSSCAPRSSRWSSR